MLYVGKRRLYDNPKINGMKDKFYIWGEKMPHPRLVFQY